ncbi:MAG TPA: glycosyltransferase family 4 protein [Bryobacteraceae bacterium]|nr:glycosyltransferase family 4 protein [Bryobacteraceae bacterium]
MSFEGFPDRRLTPAFVSPTWPMGATPNGIVTYLTGITAGLRALGHRPCILADFADGYTPGPDEFPLKPGQRSLPSRLFDGVRFRIDPHGALLARDGTGIVRAARRAMAESGAQLLEMEETFGTAHRVKRSLSIPVAVQIHGPFFANGVEARLLNDPGARQRIRLEGAAIAAADGVASPSREILGRTREYYQLSLPGAMVSPPPAPRIPLHRRWQLSKCDRNAILFVGRFDRHKGGDIMIDAFRRLAPDFQELRLWFVGRESLFADDAGRQWPLSEYLARYAPECAMRVDVLGRISTEEIDALRPRPFCTVVASRYETFGMVVLEAMAYGCPLVATRAGAIPEVVEDGVNGLLCPAGGEGLAEALRSLLSDPPLAARLGERAGEDAERRYHPETLARDRADFHRDIIERYGAKRRRTD